MRTRVALMAPAVFLLAWSAVGTAIAVRDGTVQWLAFRDIVPMLAVALFYRGLSHGR